MGSHRRRAHRSRGQRRRQWALWALAALLISALLASRQWLAQQVALENASQTSIPSQGLPEAPEETAMTEVEIIPNEPPLLPKPGADSAQAQVWRPGDSTHRQQPADWTVATRYLNPNPELISQLHQAGLNPEVMRRSGDLRVQRAWQGGRSQVALVESAVRRFAGSDWRAVYSIAHRDPAPDPALAVRLAQANAGSTLSTWSWDRGYWFAQALIPADAGKDELISAVEHVLVAADDLEQEINGETDEF